MTRAPFIPTWLDDAGLPAIQFRILAHLYRRANGTGRCWPGAESIMRTCKISDDALWPAIKALEARGFIRREKRANSNGNVYVLTTPTITPENRGTPSPTDSGGQSPANEGQPSPGYCLLPSPANGGREGMKEKVLDEGNSEKGGAPVAPFPWASIEDLPDELRLKLESAHSSTSSPAEAFASIRGRKLGFNDHHSLTDWCHVFLAEVDRQVAANRNRQGHRQGFA